MRYLANNILQFSAKYLTGRSVSPFEFAIPFEKVFKDDPPSQTITFENSLGHGVDHPFPQIAASRVCLVLLRKEMEGLPQYLPIQRATEHISVTTQSITGCSPKAMVWPRGSPLGTFVPGAPKGDAYCLVIFCQVVFMLSPMCECPKIFAQNTGCMMRNLTTCGQPQY